MCVMGGAVLVNLISFNLILKKEKPILAEEFVVAKNQVIDTKLLIGSGLFGLGWGLGGLCPGPAIVQITTMDVRMIEWVLTMSAGMLLGSALEHIDFK